MSDEREYADYLQDILDAAKKAEAFVGDMSFEQFCADDKTVFAVVRALEIIGEATKRIPEAFREKNPQTPWRSSLTRVSTSLTAPSSSVTTP